MEAEIDFSLQDEEQENYFQTEKMFNSKAKVWINKYIDGDLFYMQFGMRRNKTEFGKISLLYEKNGSKEWILSLSFGKISLVWEEK